MKKTGKIRNLILALALLSGCVKAEPAVEKHDVSLTAMIVSDLHFTERDRQSSSIIPLASDTPMLMNVIAEEVIDRKPDVFLITGDNTNSGNADDEKSLAKILNRIRQAGIPVIMTTGNHDRNLSDDSEYEANFFPLFDIDSRDQESLSWSTEVNGTTILAMDDGAASDDVGGLFSSSTMKWLESQLQEAYQKGNPILFLSHHSVLYDDGNSESTYRIRNSELKGMLEKYGVRLCLTGHQHSPSIFKEGSLNEVISSMPADGSHLIGTLTVSGSTYEYASEPIDFRTYGSEEIASYVEEKDALAADTMRSMLRERFLATELTEQEADDALDLMLDFFHWYGEGTLAVHLKEFQNSPSYDNLMHALENENYGPWIESILASPPLPASALYIQ